MTDAFALLGESRRPWLDADLLKQRFLELSATVHPDRVHTGTEEERQLANRQFADLSAAHQVLREPRDRLLHLIELESGSPPKDIQRIPPGTMDLFVDIGQACREADTFLQGRTEAPSPMLKLKQFQEAMQWTDRLMDLQKRVQGQAAGVETELKALNPIWEAAPALGQPDPEMRRRALPLDRLELLYRAISYTSRWTEQLQERLVRLAV